MQTLWADANRVAHTQLVAILEGKNEAIQTQNGKVILDLRPIVLQLANRIGLKAQAQKAIKKGEATGTLKPDFARLEIADSQQLHTARTVTKLIEGLAWFFTIGTLALFALAAWLATGRRWVVVLGYGLGLIAAGLAAMAVRAALKGPFVDSLAPTQDARVPAEHAWDIATSLLQSFATSVVIFGIGFVIASFLASRRGRRSASVGRPRRPCALVWASSGRPLGRRPDRGDPLAAERVAPVGSDPAAHRPGGRLAGGGTAEERPGVPRRQEGRLDESMRKRAREDQRDGRRMGPRSGSSPMTTERSDDAKLKRLEKLGELKEKGVLTAT